jgi:hypothetical protein
MNTINIILKKYKKIKKLMKNEFNFLDEQNGVKITNVSSEMNGCPAINLLKSDKKVNYNIFYVKFIRQFG